MPISFSNMMNKNKNNGRLNFIKNPRTRLLLLSVVPMLRMAIKQPVKGYGCEHARGIADVETMARYKLHHTRTGFQNPWLVTQPVHGQTLHGIGRKPQWSAQQKISVVPPAPINLDVEKFNKSSEPAICFIGHSTVWIRIAGLNILTDPIFGSLFPFFPRLQHLPFKIKDLPKIDIVVISHSHRDHLDIPSLKEINVDRYIVPLKCGSIIKRRVKNTRITELDWFQDLYLHNIRITCLPAQHWSKRGVGDTNRTLWAGWFLEIEGIKIFFAGDSAYFPFFREIGSKFGPFDLALLPIGAFEPKWLMGPVHMDPMEAICAAKDLRAKRFIPIHWGTFDLGDEPLDLPPKLFSKARDDAGFSKDIAPVLRPGGVWYFMKDEPPKPEYLYEWS